MNTQDETLPALPQRYKVTAFIPGMGSYTTNAKGSMMETVLENALWDFNSARGHDGLPHLTLKQFTGYIVDGDVKFTAIT